MRRQEIEVLVDFHGFALQEADDIQVPLPFPEGRTESSEPAFLVPYEMRLDIHSAGHTHTAVLVAEVWDDQPPPDTNEDGEWEAWGEAEIFSPTGRLSLEVIAGSARQILELGARGRRWKVQVFSAGRSQTARLATVGVPRRIERYTVRFWPARP
ncbi:hypothetical protein CUT44_13695 [Streptomyces carminius]|uniref:Uncharacterized protein n=1 Tax=Streptomyces carminius TaxID=2665496 RepID=A0A2M8LZ50_9ACTN|nr:hypothetical protein [Streptomyces carminius]PJE97221.1 hypothetical protein CUT44_13695 [Streptomyces carminius]